MKNYARIFIIFLFISFISAQTYVPDDNFEQALIDLGYDDVLDDYVITDSINTVTVLNVENDSISDLTGIENFTALTNLNCSRNQLTSLDMSSNTALTELICHSNDLTSLDVSNNTSLTNLRCAFNDLTSLDVSSNTALTELICNGNQLTSLDVSANIALDDFRCYNNSLTSLDVSSNTVLTKLLCGNNSLTSLDVSSNTALIKLICDGNQLTSLDVSANTALDDFRCYNNSLTSLDVSSNTSLTNLSCYNNPLTSLDVSSNTALTELKCNQNQLTSIDVSSNTALTRLECRNNQLTTLDFSNNDLLNYLDVNNNNLDSINISACLWLSHISASNNDLTSINLSMNDSLTWIVLFGNQITSIDVSDKPNLLRLSIFNNQLTTLNVDNNTLLNHLHLSGNQLESLNVNNNFNLEYLHCSNNQLIYLNMKNGVTDGFSSFNASDNDSLDCIETLDPTYATENWTFENGNIDEGVTFAAHCIPFIGPVWHVSTEGSDLTGNGSEESPFATIQTAIDSSSDSDTVLVAVGTYVENIDFDGKNIVIGSHFLTTGDTSFISQTIIDGDSSGTVVSIVNGEDSSAVLTGLTIQNGFSTSSGGIQLISSNPKLISLVVQNNYARNIGAGIMIRSSDPIIHQTVVKGNKLVGTGMGVRRGAGIFCANSSAIITETKITNNINMEGRSGGIVFVDSSFATLNDVIISYNIGTGLTCTDGSGPGPWAVHLPSRPILTNVQIIGNTGGGIEVSHDSGPTMANTTIAYNTKLSGNYGWSGGAGIFSHNGYVAFDPDNRSSIYYNSIIGRAFGADIKIVTTFPNPNPFVEVYLDTFTVLTPTDYYASPIHNLSFDILVGLDTLINSDIYVSPDGNDNNSGLSENEPFRTIGYALSRLNADSSNIRTIHLSQGVYSPESNGESFPITWNSYMNLSGAGEEETEINADSTGDVFYFENIVSSQLSNLTIKKGNPRSLIIGDSRDLLFTDMTITENIDGSAISSGHSSVIFSNVNITNNSSSSFALISIGSSQNEGGNWVGPFPQVKFENVLISGNNQIQGQSIVYAHYDNTLFNNVTITDNEVESVFRSAPTIKNTIIWDNEVDFVIHDELDDSLIFISYSNIQGGWEGTGNIDEDPRFCNPDSSDYTIAENSPCFRAGENGVHMGAFDIGCDAINFPPSDFSLLSPENGDTVHINSSNQNDSLLFEWEESIDPDGTPLQYIFSIVTVEGIGVPTFTLMYEDTLNQTHLSLSNTFIADSIAEIRDSDDTNDLVWCSWYVYAFDGLELNGGGHELAFDFSGYLGLYNEALPKEFAIHPAFPNPFNPTATLRYDLPENSLVNITVYDMLGRQVKTLVNQTQDAGYRSVIWDATNDYGRPVSAGIYLYQIHAGEYIQTKKMVLLK